MAAGHACAACPAKVRVLVQVERCFDRECEFASRPSPDRQCVYSGCSGAIAAGHPDRDPVAMNSAPELTIGLEELRRYLLNHGWFPGEHSNQRINLYETHPDESGDFSSVALPASMEYSDAPKRIQEVIQLI